MRYGGAGFVYCGDSFRAIATMCLRRYKVALTARLVPITLPPLVRILCRASGNFEQIAEAMRFLEFGFERPLEATRETLLDVGGQATCQHRRSSRVSPGNDQARLGGLLAGGG
jgi:hypothetical protein